jgi:hypothetical protein
MQKIDTREVALTLPHHMVLLNCFVGGIWGSLESQAREAPECCRQRLKGDYGRSSENQNANRNPDSKGFKQK